MLATCGHLKSQNIDTLIDLGGYKMHFVIWEGQGTPILLEAGGGNDASIWSSMAEEIHRLSNATVITYDRAGYGQSTYNPTFDNDEKARIDHGMLALRSGLEKLNLHDSLILVGHSYGGFMITLYSSLFPESIKGMMLIDASLACFYTEEYIEHVKAERTEAWLANIKNLSPPLYYECLANEASIRIMKEVSLDVNVPIVDLVAENPPFERAADNERWKVCHLQLANENDNINGTIVSNTQHYLHFDLPALAINGLLQLYLEVSNASNKGAIMQNVLDYNVSSWNDYRKGEYDYWHSENEINRWGYQLLNGKDDHAALKIFELNTSLSPDSSNAWDSLGEALLKMGQTKKAIEAYEKSVALDPENSNAIEVLERIKKK